MWVSPRHPDRDRLLARQHAQAGVTPRNGQNCTLRAGLVRTYG
jgi:hypothetical protein